MQTTQKRWLSRALRAFSALIIVTTALSQGTTQPFTFQGYLRQNNAPVSGTQQMRFRIYDAATGGNMVWDSGNLTVSVSNGLFTVTLNTPASVWTGAPRFLEIQINPPSGPTLSPRIPINPAPYANTATLLNMFQSGTNNPDRMVITHSPPYPDWGLLYRDFDDSFHFIGGGTTALRIGVGDLWTEVPSGAGLRVLGTLRIPSGAAAGRVLTSDASGNATWQPLPPSATVWAVSGNHIYNTNTGNVGIGVSSPSYRLHVETSSGSSAIFGHHTAPTGLTYGVYGRSASASGRGVYGEATAPTGLTYGVYGRSDSASGTGVYGYASAATGTTYGVLGISVSTDGTGVFGSATATTGTTYGVYGRSDSPDGRGVYGVADATTGTTYGVYGKSNSSSGRGVYGEAIATTGTTYGVEGRSASPAGRGVYGEATANTGTNYGVYGKTASPNGYGGYFEGRGYFEYNSTLTNATLRLHETEGEFARLEFTNTNTARKWHIAGFIGSAVGDDRLNFWNSQTGDVMSLTGSGRVGIGTIPNARLHVRGEPGNKSTAMITSPGGLVLTDWPGGWFGGLATYDICAAGIRYDVLVSRSDERLKRDITPLDAQYELQRLLQLRPVRYFWRDERLHKAVGEQPQFGFIAQELREIFPELVQEGGEDNILAVNYQALIPLLVNAIQLQQREIEQLRAEVQQLRAQLKR